MGGRLVSSFKAEIVKKRRFLSCFAAFVRAVPFDWRLSEPLRFAAFVTAVRRGGRTHGGAQTKKSAAGRGGSSRRRCKKRVLFQWALCGQTGAETAREQAHEGENKRRLKPDGRAAGAAAAGVRLRWDTTEFRWRSSVDHNDGRRWCTRWWPAAHRCCSQRSTCRS